MKHRKRLKKRSEYQWVVGKFQVIQYMCIFGVPAGEDGGGSDS